MNHSCDSIVFYGDPLFPIMVFHYRLLEESVYNDANDQILNYAHSFIDH